MEKFNFANVQLDAFIIVMLVIFAVYLHSEERYKQKLNRYLLYFILANILFMISDLGDWIFRIMLPLLPWQVKMLTVLSVMYYIATGLVQFTFGVYFFVYVGVDEKIKKRLLTIVGSVCGIEALISLISPFASGIFYVDKTGYHRGELFAVALFVPLFCGVIAAYVLIRYRKKLTRREIVFYSSFFVLPIIGNIIQIIMPGTAVVNISLFISIFLIIINIQFEYELKLNKQLQKSAEIKLEQAQKSIQMANETILTIANAVDAKDIKTSKHSYRVAEYSVLIAKQFGYSKEQLESLKITALLHDIGKIGIPDSILKKPACLTEEEYRIMQSHVEKGAEILKNFTLIDNVFDGVLYHHERYDGTGYTHGLKGAEIPLNARIIGVADAFDAMTSNRVYRDRLRPEKVLEQLKNGRGTQFDPNVLDVFLKLIDDRAVDIQSLSDDTAAKICGCL